ncbi:hypothetical protein QQ045_008983 [Rhodiola kirilowii]
MSHPTDDGIRQFDPPVATAEEIGLDFPAELVPPLSKKTRDLPNLAECHSCGFRIDTSNGKDKLRTLNSEWRIVLLCRKCYKLCARGKLCTYCLEEVDGEERPFKCSDCSCTVHKVCVSKFGEFAPWSYFDWRCSAVCLDCWLPSKVRKLRDVQRGNETISNFLGSDKNLMEPGENDGYYSVEKRAHLVAKPQMAFKAREKSMCKALVANVGVGKKYGGISFVSGRELGLKRKRVDDAELAFQLHRVMNSSPRISRNLRPSCSSHVDIKKKRIGRYNSYGKTSAFGQRYRAAGRGFNASFIKGFDPKNDKAEGFLKEGQGSSNNSMDSESLSWKELDLPKPEIKFTYVRRKYRSAIDGRHHQYMFKYSRRNSRLKKLVSCKYTYLYDRSSYESETSSTAIGLHNSSETRKFPDSCVLALPVFKVAKSLSKNNV